MLKRKQKIILDKYSSLGLVKGGELLLQPDLIIPFLDEISKEHVLINGCDLWKYVDSSRDPDRIVQLLDGYLIPDNYGDSVEGSAILVKRYLENNLPKDIDFISFIYNDRDIYKFIRTLGINKANNQPRGSD